MFDGPDDEEPKSCCCRDDGPETARESRFGPSEDGSVDVDAVGEWYDDGGGDETEVLAEGSEKRDEADDGG